MAAVPFEHSLESTRTGERMGSFDYRHVDVFVGVDMAK